MLNSQAGFDTKNSIVLVCGCITSSVTSLCDYILVDKFDYQELQDANPIFAPIIFFSFVLLVTFTLLSFMVTIILEGFSAVQVRLKTFIEAECPIERVTFSI